MDNSMLIGNKRIESDSIVFSFETSYSELCYSQSCGFEKYELSFSVENTGELDFKNFLIKCTSSSHFLIGLDDVCIHGNASSIFSSTNTFKRNVSLSLNQSCFKGLSEDSFESITASLYNSSGDVVSSKDIQITLKPMDYWNGNPQNLPVFIERNDPIIKDLAKKVGEVLFSLTGDSSITAYQRNSETEVLKQCAAVYSVLQSQNLIYSEPEPSEAVAGQRIRSFKEILSNKTATCLDSTILFCALVEYIGLHPIVCITYGHAFPGVWLQEKALFNSVVHDDPSDITQNCIVSNQRICVVESTLMTSRNPVPFEKARDVALEKAQTSESLKIVDIRQARLQRIKPLPGTFVNEEGEIVFIEDSDFCDTSNAPLEIDNYVLGEYEEADNTPKTKIDAWQRRLLDFSTRSPLMNLKVTANSVQILHPRLEDLEDSLNSQVSFSIIPNPLVDGDVSLQNEVAIRTNAELLMSYFSQGKLPSAETEKTLCRKLSAILRKSQNDLSETGVNTLYLSVGHIEWTEMNSSSIYRAPVLLYPVSLVRKNRNEYKLFLRDDEDPQLNYSIFEKFRNEFKYQTSLDYENLPTDDNGLDIRKIFAIIQNEIRNQARWQLVESCVLGLFSFDQFVMWNDMKKKSDKLANNKVVASLIKGELTFDPILIPKVTDEDYVNEVVPVPCDETQLYAIKAASEGNSFILQGPPGTGKSQTITGMIVDSLSKGKKVLFVAEKMAALQVVCRNLKKVNLSDYLLELHSTKVTKPHLIEQLRIAIDRKEKSRTSVQSTSEHIDRINKELSLYVETLHKKADNGLSLYEMINQYEALSGTETSDLDFSSIRDVGLEDLDDFKFHLNDLKRNIDKFRPVNTSPFRFSKLTEFGEENQLDIRNILHSFTDRVDKLLLSVSGLCDSLGIPRNLDICYSDLAVVLEENEAIKRLHELEIPAKLIELDSDEVESLFNVVYEYRAKEKQFRRKIGDDWNLAVLDLDIPSLISEWNSCKTGIFKGKQKRALINKIDSYSTHGAISENNFEETLRELNYAMSAKYELSISKAAIPLQYFRLTDEDVDLDSLGKLLKEYRILTNRLIKSICEDSFDFSVKTIACSLFYDSSSICKCSKECIGFMSIFNSITASLNLDESFSELGLKEAKQFVEYYETHISELFEWCYCNVLMRWFEDKAFGLNYAYAVVNGQTVEKAYTQLKASYFKSYIEHIVRNSPKLSRYSKDSFEEMVEELSTEEDLFRRHMVDGIPGRLDEIIASRGEDFRAKQEIIRFISSNGKRRSIRSLFSTCSKYITDICPCLLMSPMSVSQFLEPGNQMFDLVVFDEASQIPTCKAIGAIARGMNLVVVGDSKQMPPTSFFAKSVSDDEEFPIEEEKKLDLESILEDCIAIGMPSISLCWHYRSNSESLIDFSNRHYYYHRLKTYPSIDAMESKVRLIRVQGYYQPGDKEPNPFEAEVIVDAIRKRLTNKKERTQSIGVITFNEKQQSLIISKLDALFERNHNLAKVAHWFESEIDCPDKLIVKNLENIQGDERDVIMLSITFGKTKNGRFLKNFGPIGKIGGEKRLNVAFSRARCLMEVYTIINMDEFNSEELSSKGAIDLREFLRFASNRHVIENKNSSPEIVKQEIVLVLNENGFSSSFDVGLSDFKIDIAIKNPKDPNKYFCGILLDGANLTTANLSNDRFVLRRNILKKRNWNLIQVRSIDWWKDKKSTMDAIMNEVNQYFSSLENNEDSTSVSEPYEEEQEVVETSFAGTYTISDLDFTRIDSSKVINQPASVFEARFRQVIETEGPIVDDLLELRVLNSFGVKKRGKNIKQFLDDILSNMDVLKTCQKDTANDAHYVFWPSRYNEYGKNVESHYCQFRVPSNDESTKRSIQEYPQIEIGNVMMALLRENGRYLKEPLLEDTAKKMGFRRMGKDIVDTLVLVFNSAVLDGKIVTDSVSQMLKASDSDM